MTRPFERHLDDAEIDALTSLLGDSARDQGHSESYLLEAQRHVESCEDCYRNVEMHDDVQRGISQLGQVRPVTGGRDCPEKNAWLKLVAGLVPETTARELMSHAAQCDHCGPLLRSAAQILSNQVTEEEELALAALSSRFRNRQRGLAEKLVRGAQGIQFAKKRTPLWKGLVTWPRVVSVTGALAVLTVVMWLIPRTPTIRSANELLALAYSERRTLEVRTPGAKYAPMRVERGMGVSNLDKSPALLKAEALIGENLRISPNDPRWLQAKARADLLDGNYESAIKSLRRAMETEPNSPQLLTDLASAYFERAESTVRPIDYGNAIDSLGKALAKSPDDPIALFNRALISERMFLYSQAVDDWEHYLRLDPRGEWADDARRRLATLREKLKQHAEDQAEPLLSPSDIAQLGAQGGTVRGKVDERIEQYLHLVLVDWLPKAYPADRHSIGKAVFLSALTLLADITNAKHRDPWLKDLLSSTSSPHFPQAVRALAQSVSANDRGDFDSAQSFAIEAQRAFSAAGNPAGNLRARYEYVYALHLAQQGSSCLRAAAGTKQVGNSPYRWLRIQFRLDQGTCAWLVGNLGSARLYYRLALRDAETSGYPSVYLRAVNHTAGIDSGSGDELSSWNQTQHGLALYWASKLPPMQGYNLYFAWHEVADWTRQRYLDVALWRQAVTIIDSNTDVVLRAAAHSYFGNAAVAANMPDLAEPEFREAARIFASAPQTQSTRVARIEAEARLADLEVLQGQASRAYDRLSVLQPEISNLSDNLLALIFYRALGEAQFQRGALKEADVSLRAALTLSQLNLRSLQNDGVGERWSKETGRAARALVELRLRDGRTQDALETWERYHGSALGSANQSFSPSLPSPLQLARGPALPHLDSVTSNLSTLTRETVVCYAVFSDGVEIWAYDSRGVISHWIALPAEQLQALVLHFRNLCADPNSDLVHLRRDSRQLYNLLIAPIEQAISSDRALVVEGDDELNGLPFEALLDSQGRYLAERIPVATSLGFYDMEALRPASALSKSSRSLIVAVPAPEMADGDPLPALTDAQEEGRTVADKFEYPVLLQGKDATADAVLRHLSGISVFHFAGHSVATTSRAGLLLSDRLLGATLLESAHLSSLQLAVLSACETEGDTNGSPVDSNSLVRTFLRAGVPHVVASGWNVDSASTRVFMQGFYAALLSGKTVSGSLQTSILALKGRSGMNHPYYWSGFHAFGRI